jgi:RimJ/RimL family protein N-acetyltransferase
MQLSHRPARPDDHGFICSCILNGARKDHYSLDASDSQAVRHFKQDMTTRLRSTGADGQQEYIYIFLLGQQRIGLVMLTGLDTSNYNFELYALSVLPRFQGKGYGKLILDIIMRKLHKQVVYARCAEASKAMRHLLLKYDFQCISHTDQGIYVMRRDNLDMTDIQKTEKGIYSEDGSRAQAHSPGR